MTKNTNTMISKFKFCCYEVIIGEYRSIEMMIKTIKRKPKNLIH